MPFKLICGPAGSGKTSRAIDHYLEALDTGAKPLFIAPSGPDVRHFRREVIRRAGILAGGSVTTFGNLSRDILSLTGSSPRIIDSAERKMLLRAVIDQTDNLTLLKESSAYRGFIEAVSRLIGELQGAGVTPEELATAAKGILDYQMNADLFRIYEDYRVSLADQEAVDLELAQCLVAKKIIAEPGLLGFDLAVIDGFRDFTAIEHSLISAFEAVLVDVIMTAPHEPGRIVTEAVGSSFARYFENAEREELDPPAEDHRPAPLVHIDRYLYETGSDRHGAGGAVFLVKGAGARGEAEMIAAEIIRLVGEGQGLDGVAIVCRNAECEMAVAAALDDFAIPYELNAAVRLADMPLGNAVIKLLEFIMARQDGAGVRGETDAALLGYLRSSLPVASESKVDAFARQVRLHGICEPEQMVDTWLSSGGRRLGEIEAIEAAAARGIADLGRQVCDHARRLVAAAVARADTLGANDPASCAFDFQALQLIEGVCSEAALLAERGGRGRSALSLLHGGLADADWRPPSGKTRNCVRILDPHRVLNQRFDVVFISGLVEGVFPFLGQDDPFINDAERKALRSRGIDLDLKANQLEDERFLFYRALTRARERIYLSFPYCDSEGKENVHSLFIDDLLEIIAIDSSHELVRNISDTAFSTGKAPVRKQALRSLCLAAGLARTGDATPPAELLERLGKAAGAAGLDGRLAECIAAAEPVLPAIVSPEVQAFFAGMTDFHATHLERYARCPFGYFTETFLDPAPMDLADFLKNRGIVAHDVLARFLKETKSHVAIRDADDAQLQVLAEKMDQVLDETLARYGVGDDITGAMLGHTLRGHLQRFIERERSSGGRLLPDGFELKFGSGESTRGAVNLGEGLTLSGRIDRVDRDPGSDRALVIDYKTGKILTTWKNYGEEGIVQVPLYVLAAPGCGYTPLGGEYYPVTGDKRRGFYLEEFKDLVGSDKSRNDYVSREQFDEILDSTRELALSLAKRIRAMDFRAEPNDENNCKRCGFLALCRRKQSGGGG